MARIEIPLGLGFGKGRSGVAGMQSCVNFYVEEVKNEPRSRTVLHGSPGKALFSTIAIGDIRGQITASDVSYVVSGTRFQSVTNSGVTADLGEVEGTELVRMAFNGAQIGICAELKSYEFDVPTNTLAEITDPSAEQFSDVDSLASYLIWTVKGTGRFRWKLVNATSFGALDFATAEAESDALTFIRKVGDELALGGKTSLEWWYATGDTGANAFAKRSVAAAPIGSDSRDTAIVVDGGLTFVGRDGTAGGTSFYRAQGYQPQKISTPQIDGYLEAVTDKTALHAFVYQQNGHLFAVLTNPGEWTFAWDVLTNQWAPRKTGSWSMGAEPSGGWDAVTFTLNGSKQIVGSADGNLYELQADTLTDNAQPIVREATTPIIGDGNMQRMKDLELECETGVGLASGQGSAPLVYESHSDDNGHTWSTPRSATMGPIGEYMWRCRWSVMGSYRYRIQKFRCSDPVPITFLKAVANVSRGAH